MKLSRDTIHGYIPPDDECPVVFQALRCGITPVSLLMGGHYFRRCLEADGYLEKYSKILQTVTHRNTLRCLPIAPYVVDDDVRRGGTCIIRTYIACILIAVKMIETQQSLVFYWQHLCTNMGVPLVDNDLIQMELACLHLLGWELNVGVVTSFITMYDSCEVQDPKHTSLKRRAPEIQHPVQKMIKV